MPRNYKLHTSKQTSHTLKNVNSHSNWPIKRAYTTQIVNSSLIGNNAIDVITALSYIHRITQQKFILSLACMHQLTSKRSLMALLNPSILTNKAETISELRSQPT